MRWELVAAAALVNHKSKQRCCGMAVVWVRAALRWPNYSGVPINHSWWWVLNTSTHSVVPLHIKVMGHLYGAPFPVNIALWSHNAAFTTYVGSGCRWNRLYGRRGDPFLFAAMLVKCDEDECRGTNSFICCVCGAITHCIKENQNPTNRDTTYLSLKPCLQMVITPPWGIFMPGNRVLVLITT